MSEIELLQVGGLRSLSKSLIDLHTKYKGDSHQDTVKIPYTVKVPNSQKLYLRAQMDLEGVLGHYTYVFYLIPMIESFVERL